MSLPPLGGVENDFHLGVEFDCLDGYLSMSSLSAAEKNPFYTKTQPLLATK